MARSRKKPYHYCVCVAPSAMADWKREINRRFRRICRNRLHQGKEPPQFREVANLWSSPGDGGKRLFEGAKYTRK